ncbi:MAG: hypothetical protein G01um101448_586 [Parcubacteria group bacterium Gr01-1014_48]|nr:MAG: hypothetical protein Greene041614_676 [Parcubacteria group bacterium Greene0416_14]TSC73745.1 MAG: hypothetical protein G01um101448_586 [Parcubacteria group bacterium Gr01-1014_48]TSD01362.1 MAG: hypothetical protein Greene101415_297 [Parcubacteria group bacterium Greene1014_15]TSD06797.1 MAG: hypothetical protein Greene07144_1097 [Parcubacteria group bacterium Greene0714_4]
MKIAILFLSTLVVLSAVFLLMSRSPSDAPSPLFVDVEGKDVRIALLMADTAELRARGLSGRKSLSANEGMWFIMESPGIHGIWMKEMYFPIDIIWLDDSHRIVTIEPLVAPASYPKVFYPTVRARYVLEVNAGFTAEHGIVAGDRILLGL